MKRVVFVNLHANPMLVKILDKFIFKQSFAVKHKYLLDYLLEDPNYEVCSYINKRGFSMVTSFHSVVLDFLNLFRFWEHNYVLRKNGYDPQKITIIKHLEDIRKEDLVILYRHCPQQLIDADKITSFKALSMIHFWGTKSESKVLEHVNPDVLFCESDLSKYSEIFKRYYSWYKKDFIVHSFVFAPRFKRIKPFAERENQAFATGTITYKKDPDFLEVYGEPCDQPIRKQIKDNADCLKSLIYCTSNDYTENVKSTAKIKRNNALTRFYKALHYKLFESQQRVYYSFDMVQSFNNYKMCIVGEEILGVPGIGFVEGMACGCAYIGQRIGYYEDLGMQEGVHYIGYDGTLDDLKAKIKYYQQSENQDELEFIANAGYEFAQRFFNSTTSASVLMEKLVEEQLRYKR